MTAIVGIRTEDAVYVGADRVISNFGPQVSSYSRLGYPKVFEKKGGMILGAAGSVRCLQILRYDVQLPKHPPGMDVVHYLVTKFVDAVRESFEVGGSIGSDEDGAYAGLTAIIGYRNRLFWMHQDFQIVEILDEYIAAGSGEYPCLGSLYTTRAVSAQVPPELRCVLALQAASSIVLGVGPPFDVYKVKGGKPEQVLCGVS